MLVRPLLFGQPESKTQPAIPKELTSYRDVVKKVLPAVVSIESRVKPKVATKKRQPKQIPFNEQGIPEEFRKFFKEFENRQWDMPNPCPQYGFGSGFIVDPKGVILTANHVVAGADQLVVTLRDGSKYVSKKFHGDRKTDLAVVFIKPRGDKPLPYLELGDSSAMEIGDRVLAVGAPFGLTGSVTAGIVSAKGRNGLKMNMYEDFIQTDAAINPGNSGGPLVNLEGKVVGINSAIKTRSGGFQGVGLAIASDLAREIMKALVTKGKVERGFLGIQITELTAEVAKQLGLPARGGVVVREVFKGSPADNAGLKAGDIITEIHGKKVGEGRVLQTTVAGLPLHKAVPVTIFRDGKKMTLKVTIEEQPDVLGPKTTPDKNDTQKGDEKEQETISLSKIGVEVADLTKDMAQELGYKKITSGAVITKVDPEGLAGEAGLRKGMLILKVGKIPVKSAAAVRDAMAKASLEKGVLLQLRSPEGGTDYVVLKAESDK
jgi:serine protease Do